jgi:hypothetical protein
MPICNLGARAALCSASTVSAGLVPTMVGSPPAQGIPFPEIWKLSGSTMIHRVAVSRISRLHRLAGLISLVMGFAQNNLAAQTFHRDGEVNRPLVGSILPQDTFVFHLGGIAPDSVPEAVNHSEGLSNWRVFNQAEQNETFDDIAGTAHPYCDAKSCETGASDLSFAGLESYLWIRTYTPLGETTNSRLTRAESWLFPRCGNTDLLQWSARDLAVTANPPLPGPKSIDDTSFLVPSGTSSLPTYTVIPEPSSVVLAVVGGFFLLRRRR